MALTLQEVAEQLQARLNESSGENLADLSTEVLVERHSELKTERLAMPETASPQDKAAATNKVKRIEAILTERGVEFVPMPQANRPLSLDDMTEQELVDEFARIEREYPNAPAGQKSSMTTRLKAMKIEVAKRLEQLNIAPATDTVQPEPEAEGPTDAELVEVAATATVEEQPEQPTRSRRRRS